MDTAKILQTAIEAADTIERQAKGLDAGRELMRQAWHAFNAIRARDGAPVGVSEEWWSQMTEELGKLLGDEAKPWMSDAAQALLAPSHAEICEMQDRVIKAEQERDAALAEVERLKGALDTARTASDRVIESLNNRIDELTGQIELWRDMTGKARVERALRRVVDR